MKVHLRTFGCRANQYDTEAVRGMIEASGGAVVADAADADVIVFNSCTVTSDAEADLRRVPEVAAGRRHLQVLRGGGEGSEREEADRAVRGGA